jgi:phospholipase A1
MLHARSLLLVAALLAAVGAQGSPETCAYIPQPEARLNCFDSYFRPSESAAFEASGSSMTSSESLPRISMIEARIEQEAALTDQWFSITPHHRNYILPATYNADADFSAAGPAGQVFSDFEIKMQLSLKTRLASGLWRDSSVWAAYTQQSYWQLYAEEEASSPFRETNHQPEVFWQVPVDFEVLGWNARIATLALNHQSNGRSEPLSRSWNRVTAALALDRGSWAINAKTWARIEESADTDDNPDIEDYMGRLELGLAHTRERHTFSVVLKNNLRSDNRSGVEVNYTFPLLRHLKGFVQLYSGYGENLIDMENYTNRIGLGIALTDAL